MLDARLAVPVIRSVAGAEPFNLSVSKHPHLEARANNAILPGPEGEAVKMNEMPGNHF